jgi:hypothetical protein
VARTQEQIDADDLMEKAVSAVLRAYDQVPEEAVVVDFLMIVETDVLTSENGTRYSLQMRMGRMRASVGLGLCDIAQGILLEDE